MSSINRFRIGAARLGAWALASGVVFSATALAQVPVTGVAGGARLSDLAGTSTLVTVVLKESSATDTNCQVLEVAPTYLAVLSTDGLRNAYLFKDLAEVRVQGGEVKSDRKDLTSNRPLSDEEKRLYGEVQAKASDIFERAIGDQGIRMRAATITGLEDDERAISYLKQRAEGNDMYTALRATIALGLIGQADPNPELIRGGLASGLRNVKTATIYCIGLLQLSDFEDRLLGLVKERLPEIAIPSAFALGQIKSEAGVPALLNMVVSLNDEKAEAAKEALINIGGDSVLTGLKTILPNTTGGARFRIVEALYRMGDPLGERILKDESIKIPTLSVDAAITLVKGGDFDSREFLQNKLDEKFEPTLYNNLQRLRMAAALLSVGDRKNYATLQAMLGGDQNLQLQYAALSYIAILRDRNLAELATPALGSADDQMASYAAQVITVCFKPEYGERFNTMLNSGMLP